MSRSLQELNLIDNFLFFSAIDHEEYGPIVAGTILETILQCEVQIGKIDSFYRRVYARECV